MTLGVYATLKSTEYGWGSAHTLGFAPPRSPSLAAFVALEARPRNPILPLRILRTRSLTGSSVVRGFAATRMFTTSWEGSTSSTCSDAMRSRLGWRSCR
jgi:hypothetical protein